MTSNLEAEALDAYSQAVTQAAERVGPAVVRIDTTSAVTGDRRRGRRRQSGTGTGLIYASDGHIVTNYHVVAGASQLKVTLADGRSYPAAVLHTDPTVDLAVIRIPASGLPVAKLSRQALRVGQLVVAVGTAFGLGGTVTAGVVSALKRDLQEGPVRLASLIQTDTPINPGNSGGPLVDAQGNVVGITVAILPYARGIGFAIPTETVLTTLGHFMTEPESPAGAWLGISGIKTAIEPATVRQQKLTSNEGVLVLEVHSGSPAANASLRAMDVILAIAGQPARSPEALVKAVSAIEAEQPVEITFLRDHRKRRVTAVLGQRARPVAG